MRAQRVRQTLWGILLIAVGVTRPPLAIAQESKDLATAEVLFDDALRLMREGQYELACPKFEQSLKIDTGIGATLWLADCYERSGRLAAAWTTFRQAVWLAQQEKDDRLAIAQQKVDAIEPRLPRLTMTVASSAALPGLRVERDGAPVTREAWGVSIPVDPGRHVVVALAEGKKSWRHVVEVKEAEKVSVEIPVLADLPKPVATTPMRSTLGDSLNGPAADDGGGTSLQSTAGWGLLGLGIASMGVGSYFGLQAKSKFDDSKAGCTGSVCNVEGGALRGEARDAANRSTLFFAVGAAVAFGGGLTLALTPAADEPVSENRVSWAPVLGPGTGAIMASGSF